jgi:hypothetical protein
MTGTDHPSKEPSINDSLPTSNPSLRTVLLVLASIVAIAVMLVLYMEYGS